MGRDRAGREGAAGGDIVPVVVVVVVVPRPSEKSLFILMNTLSFRDYSVFFRAYSCAAMEKGENRIRSL